MEALFQVLEAHCHHPPSLPPLSLHHPPGEEGGEGEVTLGVEGEAGGSRQGEGAGQGEVGAEAQTNRREGQAEEGRWV